MAHFAKINENNIVEEVIVIPNEQEHRGQEFINQDLGILGTWIQCSYNTIKGKHTKDGTPLRGNYAGQGFIYNPDLDVFYRPKPYESWHFDEEIFDWVAPIPKPEGLYNWNEEIQNWIEV